MARSLADRLHAHEQQTARLAKQEAKLRTAEHKARTRQVIEAGGLMDKSGLLGLGANVLYGALLSLGDAISDNDQVRKWAEHGGRAFAREARQRDEDKEPVVLTFPAALDRDASTALRAAGFRFNKILQHWEGLARPDDASKLAKTHHGTLQRVAPAPPSPAPKLPTAAQ